MNATMLLHLLRKDLRLAWLPITGYFAAGLLAVLLLGLENKPAFYAGTVVLITALIVLGVHPTVITVVNERKEGTLAFVLSLPISPAHYLRSKLLFNLLVFFIPWTILLLATCSLFAWQAAIPDGLIPFTTILFGAIATNTVLILSVALVTESMDYTIATMAACNLVFHGILYSAALTSSQGDVARWDATVFSYLLVFLLIAAASVGFALWRHSKKTDFL